MFNETWGLAVMSQDNVGMVGGEARGMRGGSSLVLVNITRVAEHRRVNVRIVVNGARSFRQPRSQARASRATNWPSDHLVERIVVSFRVCVVYAPDEHTHWHIVAQGMQTHHANEFSEST